MPTAAMTQQQQQRAFPTFPCTQRVPSLTPIDNDDVRLALACALGGGYRSNGTTCTIVRVVPSLLEPHLRPPLLLPVGIPTGGTSTGAVMAPNTCGLPVLLPG